MLTSKAWGYHLACKSNVSCGAKPAPSSVPAMPGLEAGSEQRWKPKAGFFFQQIFKSRVRLENPHVLLMNPPCDNLNAQTQHAHGIPEIVETEPFFPTLKFHSNLPLRDIRDHCSQAPRGISHPVPAFCSLRCYFGNSVIYWVVQQSTTGPLAKIIPCLSSGN